MVKPTVTYEKRLSRLKCNYNVCVNHVFFFFLNILYAFLPKISQKPLLQLLDRLQRDLPTALFQKWSEIWLRYHVMSFPFLSLQKPLCFPSSECLTSLPTDTVREYEEECSGKGGVTVPRFTAWLNHDTAVSEVVSPWKLEGLEVRW